MDTRQEEETNMSAEKGWIADPPPEPTQWHMPAWVEALRDCVARQEKQKKAVKDKKR